MADDDARLAALEAILGARRSVRRFRTDPVPAARIERLLAAAVTAPSASNKQPWRFLVVERRATIDAMATAVRAEVAVLRRSVPPESEASFAAYGEYFTRFEHAPTVIVPIHRGHQVLSHLVAVDVGDERRRGIAAMERDSGLVGASLATMNLLLAASEGGLGASAMTGPLVAASQLREILEIPPSWGIVAVVAVGYSDEVPTPTDRKAVDKVVRWIR